MREEEKKEERKTIMMPMQLSWLVQMLQLPKPDTNQHATSRVITGREDTERETEIETKSLPAERQNWVWVRATNESETPMATGLVV